MQQSYAARSPPGLAAYAWDFGESYATHSFPFSLHTRFALASVQGLVVRGALQSLSETSFWYSVITWYGCGYMQLLTRLA